MLHSPTQSTHCHLQTSTQSKISIHHYEFVAPREAELPIKSFLSSIACFQKPHVIEAKSSDTQTVFLNHINELNQSNVRRASQRLLTVEFVDGNCVVAFARTQSVLVNLVFERTGLESDTQHAVLDLVALPSTRLQHVVPQTTLRSSPHYIRHIQNSRHAKREDSK